MAYFTYILQSEITGRKYYGSCADIDIRLQKHNSGKVKSTKAFKPYKIIYFETFNTRSEAYRREIFFKTIDGYKFLKQNHII